MSEENSIIPISDAQSEAIKEIVGAVRDGGGYLTEILGDLPKDLVGLIGDKIKIYRATRLQKLWDDAKHHLGIQQPETPCLKLALPIFTEAVDESREELQDLWARLLAASMHLEKSKRFRLAFIETAKKLDPLDVRVLLEIKLNPHNTFQVGSEAGKLAQHLGVGFDEVKISLDNLEECKILSQIGSIDKGLSSYGKEFLRAVEF
ncbi:DUF4393 domain-containing protein [Methylomonas paludis]|uniref:DUF4393 domain-containing protein n=1 Tax=Methylomonas paludis TaxID=1173101 RepID=A0A975MN39_9GAMM|nr:Abi-alpha family protein [Methylomonas paludis]QWF70913.1 DUF4393 domain-containing protein [Methylomonas paludis]